MTPSGTQRELPRVAGRPTFPEGIVTGPDGNLWFTDFDAIGRMTTTGVVTMFSTPTLAPYATDIAVGSDGNLWFTEQVGNSRPHHPGRRHHRIPGSRAADDHDSDLAFMITAGPDGNLWFTEPSPNRLAASRRRGHSPNFRS